MHDDLRQLLNAYLDGELHGVRLLQMQTHLTSCAICRTELKELRQVTDLLHAAPTPAFKPVERFIAELDAELPRRTLKEQPPKPGSLLWWVVPACLVGAWFFLRTTFTITTIISTVDMTGMLDQVTGLFNSGGGRSILLVLADWMSGGQAAGTGSTVMSILNVVDQFNSNLFTSFLGQVVIVALYWLWLAAWWWKQRPRPMKVSTSPVQA